MRVALISPTDIGPLTNPGSHMITAGIRYLVRKAFPDASIMVLDMMNDLPHVWKLALTCDVAILSGNPRFTSSPGGAWWNTGIWGRLAELQSNGVKVIDGWSGGCVGHPIGELTDMAQAIASNPRNKRIFPDVRKISGRIVRDKLLAAAYKMEQIPHVFLPCSAWWAAAQYSVEPEKERDRDAIVLIRMPGNEWIGGAVQRIQRQMAQDRPTDIVACHFEDYEWAESCGIPNVLPLHDPESLCLLYASCRRVLAFRIHAAIPAASVGCEVSCIEIDGRVLTIEPFGIPWHPFTDLINESFVPNFALGIQPDETAVVQTFRDMMI